MNVVNEVIICISCKQKLKAPVFLPCGYSICKHHIEDDDKEEVENNKRRKIECNCCNATHEIPENGFAPNRALESLIDVNIDELDLGKEYNSAFEKCSQFKDLLGQFNNAKNDPETRIYEVLSELRNKVDLRRELLKLEIDKKALEIIEKINEYEKKCRASIKLNSNLNNKIGEWENDLLESRLFLKTIKKNTEKWNEISNKMTSFLKDLQSEFIKLNESLFLNRLNEFLFCNLNLTDNDYHLFCVEVKELSRCKDIKEKNRKLTHHVFKAYDIEWNLRVFVNAENTSPRDKFVGIYLGFDGRTTKIQNVIVDFELVILDQLNMDKNIIRSFSRVFNSGVGYGFGNFITLNDLLENYNLYNVEKDSFMVQVVIKKIKWL